VRDLFRNEFVRFVLTGGTAAAVNVAARILLSLIMPFEAAVTLAFPFGVLTAYALSRRYVFKPKGGARTAELARFTLVNLVALLQVWVVSVGMAKLVFPAMGFGWHAETIAHVIGVMSPIGTSYFAHRHFSFAVGRG